MKTLLIILSIFITTNAYAGRWICYDGTTKKVTKRVQGDCRALGLCSGFDNQGLQANCFEAKKQEWNDARFSNKKVDISNSTNKIINLTTAELDSEKAQRDSDKMASERTSAENLEVSTKDIIIAFIKVYNSKVALSLKITKKELTDQIKADKGL